MTNQEPPADIVAALAAIAADLPRFTHDDRVGTGRGAASYGFTSVDAIQDHLRPMFAAHGVMYRPSEMRVLTDNQVERHRTNDDGTVWTQYQWRVVIYTEWTFHHAPSGTMLVVPSIGEAMDTADKAANKAMTAARKYVLINVLNISTGEDPDRERTGDGNHRHAGGGPRPASPKQIGFLKRLLGDGRRAYPSDDVASAALVDAVTGVVNDDDLPAIRKALDDYAYGAEGHVSGAFDDLPAAVVSKMIDVMNGGDR